MKLASKVVVACGLVVVLLSMAACNTVKGVGKDTAAVGDSIKNSAEKNGAD